MEEITEEERLQMCEYYAWVNYMYYQGKAVEIRDAAYEDPAYGLWDSKGYITVLRGLCGVHPQRCEAGLQLSGSRVENEITPFVVLSGRSGCIE